MNRCQAEKYCKGFPDRCHEYCIGYVQLHNIYKLSGIPKKYQYDLPLTCERDDRDRDAFVFLRDFQNDIEDHIKEGHGLFIHSATKGNGKTSWACKIMNEHFKKVAIENNLRCRGLFINVPDFLDKLREDMDKDDDELSEEMRETQYCIRTADLVIWDDIGTENPTKWVRQTLYKFINFREANNKSQIFTSNVPLLDLVREEYLGERVVNRIAGQCKVVEIAGPSRREPQW